MVEIAVSGVAETVTVGEELVAVVTATGLGKEKTYILQARILENAVASEQITTDAQGNWAGAFGMGTLNDPGITILTVRAVENDTNYWDSQVTAVSVENRVLGQAAMVVPTVPYGNPSPLPTAIGGILLGIVVAIAVIMAINGGKKGVTGMGSK